MSEPTPSDVVERTRKAWPAAEYELEYTYDPNAKLVFVAIYAWDGGIVYENSAPTLRELYDKIAADPPET